MERCEGIGVQNDSRPGPYRGGAAVSATSLPAISIFLRRMNQERFMRHFSLWKRLTQPAGLPRNG